MCVTREQADVMVDRIRVLLADDHTGLREALRALISLENDVEVVGEADSGEQAIAGVMALRPDVLLVDVTMPGIDGIETIRRIREMRSDVKVVVLTAESEAEHLQPAMEAGAGGYVAKSVADREVVPAIRAVARGMTYLAARS